MRSQAIVQVDKGKLGHVAAKLFLGITEEWGLTDEQKRVLAGAATRTTISSWKKKVADSSSLNLGDDTLERLSYIAGIYKALQILLPTQQQWAEWVHKPNSAFGGQTALERMLGGRVADLYEVRHYLDAQRG